jgi:hypothetical protein
LSVRAKLAGFALVLVAIFGAGYGIGAATDTSDAPVPSHQEHGP